MKKDTAEIKVYKALKPIVTHSAWHILKDSYKADKITIFFILCLKSLKIEILLYKQNIDEDIKRMMKSVNDRGNG